MKSACTANTHLVCNVGSRITDVAVHLAHNSDMLVAVQKGILLLALHSHTVSTASMGSLVGLETGIGEDNDKPWAILIAVSNWNMLLCDKLGEGGRR